MQLELTGKQQTAAILVAEDELTDQVIAETVGVNKVTLERWKQRPDFSAAVKAHIATLQEELSRYSVARKDRRLAFMERRYRALQQTMDERRADALLSVQPGGTTGIVDKRIIPGARAHSYEIDSTLLDAALKIEKQAAQEMGQWTERTAFEGRVQLDVQTFFQEIENRWGEESHLELLPTLPDASSA